MLVNTPAIVLRSVDFKESSKIVTLLTRQQGRIGVMARSLKRPKSRMGGLMEHGAILDAVLYVKQSRQVQDIKEAMQRQATFAIHSDMEKMAIASATLEMLDQMSTEHESNAELYDFAESLLTWLHATTHSPVNLFPYIQLRLAGIMGIGLQNEVSGKVAADKTGPGDPDGSGPEGPEDPDGSGQGTVDRELYLNVEEGNLSDEPGEGLSYRLSPGQSAYLWHALSGRRKRLLELQVASADRKHLIYHLDVYLQHHVEGIRSRKSDRIFQQIL